jgi:tetratricopeptide (TPR) repeat protein
MKKIIYIFILMAFISCDDFLDVNPKSVVVNDDLFENDEGFQDAIYGVNSSLAVEELYGQRISYEFTDLSAQLFVPSTDLKRNDLSRCKFIDSYATKSIKNVWKKMYEVIGYVNNILLNLEEKTPEEIRHYNMYKGEALGLRAAMHFDLLRLFAVDINSSNQEALKRGIPYVWTYNYAITKFSSVEKVYGYILEDLLEAEKLLKEDENLISFPRKAGGRYFTDARITHMNLYAVQAMLARVYWQKKDMTNAAIYAKKVIDSDKFHLMLKTDLDTELASVMSFNETIWGLYSNKFYEETAIKLFDRSDHLCVDPNYEANYEVDESLGRDYRLDWFGLDEQNYKCLIKFYNSLAKEKEDNYDDSKGYLGINMIRIPEMYYIMAEALLETDLDEATKYFDAVIESRGILGIGKRIDGTVLTRQMIMEERRKEFIGEGQEWFRMKRDNEDITLITSGGVTPASDNLYKWPYPDVEDEMNQ